MQQFSCLTNLEIGTNKLQEISGLFTERLIEISVEYSIRGGIIQTLVRLNGIVEINETEKLNESIGAVFEVNLTVPHVYQCADNRLGFTVVLRTIDTSKLLTNTVLPASFEESMIVSSFKFRAVVGIRAVDLTSTLIIIVTNNVL